MKEVGIIGIDLAKRVFQLHGADSDGTVVFCKKLSRASLVRFLAAQPKCTIAMEACATAHYWGREVTKLGHKVRLLPPIYVKPFVKPQKNDTADAEAIAEAASRPTMRLVEVKSQQQQSQGMVLRSRNLLEHFTFKWNHYKCSISLFQRVFLSKKPVPTFSEIR